MVYTEAEQVGERTLLMGNEAIARGAIEAGVRFATSYPGTPASEVLERLADVAEDLGIHVEWSTNEMVAVEAAAAASFSGFRSITSMKQNGLNVIVDFLKTLAYHGTGSGGQLIVVADDPQAWSSANEQDSRLAAKFMEIPILEPSSHQEAKDLIPYAFNLSERYNIPVIIRETTRMALYLQ